VKPSVIGVAGAGTMGAGIAQLGCAAGMRTLLHDPVPEALERGVERVRAGLGKWAEKGRASGEAASLLEPTESLDGLGGCELVIEAAPERAELKRELFERLSEVCGPDTVLATNTSSIPVTSLARATARPDNFVGMHFFNPPPLMRLLEVIRADQTGERALAVARATGEAMGKQVILAADGPGFLVNRCGRPFPAEGLRLLEERVATHEQIDRICRLGGGFPMGPFELMDLVGIDVGFEVAKSFTELSFGEPRWRPSPIQARMVAAGRLGRKSGRGYYEYSEDAPYRPHDPDPLEPGGGDGRTVLVAGAGALAKQLRERARAAGFAVRDEHQLSAEAPAIMVDAAIPSRARSIAPVPTEVDLAGIAGVPGPETEQADTAGAPAGDLAETPPDATGAPAGGLVEAPVLPVQLCACAERSLATRGEPHAVGFQLLPPLDDVRLVELTRLPSTPSEAAVAAEDFFRALGFHPEWVGDAPGLVLGRIVCQLANEAWFAIGEGVGSADDVDTGLTLGLSHPRGPVAWAQTIGLEHVLAVLDGLWEERHEERYRAAPLLRREVMMWATR
jgi:3-hydroxybutyryl-CoA dehydrogenase